jgi:hypothetical protein
MTQTRVGARVSCADGWAGTLAQWVRDPGTGQTTHLVVKVSPSQKPATVPVGHVMAVGYHTVFLEMMRSQLFKTAS